MLELGEHTKHMKELRGSVAALERCQKALSDFLETKRQAMPRFYFIGDEDLLELLGQSKRIDVVHAHLKKLFQGIHRIEVSPDRRITAVKASSSETVVLSKPVAMEAQIEVWLGDLAKSSAAAVADDINAALAKRQSPLGTSGINQSPVDAAQLDSFSG